MSTTNDPQKLALYILPDKGSSGAPGHKALTIRRTAKNAKGRYVTGPQVAVMGLFWAPSRFPMTRDELAMSIGRIVLDEAGV